MKITEFVQADEILQYVKFHDELNPKLWDHDKLRPEVREKFIETVDEFIDFIEIDELNIDDILFTGSNCGYNYSSLSDCDVHLLIDFSQLDCTEEFAQNFFDTKKNLWNRIHDIEIEGFTFEIYVESVKNPVNASGIYSVKNDEWIKHPEKVKPSINDTSIVQKTNQYVDEINDLLESKPTKADLKEMVAKIYKLRKCGLEDGGEFSTENLVFKSIRNLGYLDKIKKYIIDTTDKELSL